MELFSLNPWIVNHARETDTIRRGPVDRRYFRERAHRMDKTA